MRTVTKFVALAVAVVVLTIASATTVQADTGSVTAAPEHRGGSTWCGCHDWLCWLLHHIFGGHPHCPVPPPDNPPPVSVPPPTSAVPTPPRTTPPRVPPPPTHAPPATHPAPGRPAPPPRRVAPSLRTAEVAEPTPSARPSPSRSRRSPPPPPPSASPSPTHRRYQAAAYRTPEPPLSTAQRRWIITNSMLFLIAVLIAVRARRFRRR